MLDKLFGKLDGQKEEMKARLADVKLEAEVENGAIKVTANANRELLDIVIDPEKIDLNQKEQLEDLLLIAVNQVLEIAAEKEADEAQKMISDMIPSGLGGLFGIKND